MENIFLKKLQIKHGHIIKMVDAPENAAAIFSEIPSDVIIKHTNVADFNALITFATNKEQLNKQIESNLMFINSKTLFWVFYPKKLSKIKSDLDLMKTWQELDTYGLSPCASVAVNEVWTGLRLKLSTDIKPSGMRNDHIKTNEYGEYIDTVNKIITLPPDLAFKLSSYPIALNHYLSLSYTNRKEYVLWILSAKQSITRANRVEKTVEMLLIGKKNPTDKG